MSEENAAPNPPAVPSAHDVVEAFRAALAAHLPAEDLAGVELDHIGAATAMLSLPIDSAVLMALMTDLEDTFGIFIDEESAFAFSTVGDVADHIAHRVADKARRLGSP